MTQAMKKANVLTEADVMRLLDTREQMLERHVGQIAEHTAMSVMERNRVLNEREREMRGLSRERGYGMDWSNARQAESPYWRSMPAISQSVWGTIQHVMSGIDVASGADRTAVAVLPEPVTPMPEMAAISTVAVEVSDEDMADQGKLLAMEAESVLGYSALRTKLKAPSQLRCVLAKLEIEVLNPEEVAKYKQGVKDHFRTSKKMSDPTWTVCKLSAYTGPVPEFVISKAIEVKRELPNAEFFVEHFQEDPFLIVSTMSNAASYCSRHSSMGQFAIDKPDDTMYLEVWNEKSFEAGL